MRYLAGVMDQEVRDWGRAASQQLQTANIGRGQTSQGDCDCGFPLIPSDYHSVRVFGVQSIIQPRHYTQEPLVERPDTFVVTVNAVLLVVYWLSQHGRRIASLLLLLRSSVLHISLSLLKPMFKPFNSFLTPCFAAFVV